MSIVYYRTTNFIDITRSFTAAANFALLARYGIDLLPNN